MCFPSNFKKSLKIGCWTWQNKNVFTLSRSHQILFSSLITIFQVLCFGLEFHSSYDGLSLWENVCSIMKPWKNKDQNHGAHHIPPAGKWPFKTGVYAVFWPQESISFGSAWAFMLHGSSLSSWSSNVFTLHICLVFKFLAHAWWLWQWMVQKILG